MSDSRPGVEAPLVDRPNGEPPIVRGLTATELAWAAGLAFFCWLPAGLVLARVAGTPVVAVLFCSIVPTATVYVLAGWFLRLKRDRPQDYHILLAKRTLACAFGLGERYIDRLGLWDLGRSLAKPARRRRARARSHDPAPRTSR